MRVNFSVTGELSVSRIHELIIGLSRKTVNSQYFTYFRILSTFRLKAGRNGKKSLPLSFLNKV